VLLPPQAASLAQQADVAAARAELRFPEAEATVQHLETARSALVQVWAEADLPSTALCRILPRYRGFGARCLHID
jgi:hypothetical protein